LANQKTKKPSPLKDGIVVKMSEKREKNPVEGENRGIAFVILAIAANIVGLANLAFGNVPVASGLLVGSLVSLVISLFYSTREYRQMKKGKAMDISKK
jgi:xanthine/uracil permease